MSDKHPMSELLHAKIEGVGSHARIEPGISLLAVAAELDRLHTIEQEAKKQASELRKIASAIDGHFTNKGLVDLAWMVTRIEEAASALTNSTADAQREKPCQG